ncbi:hypothetical protein [Streptomyces sp. SID6139]|uniref:hypothetical protein n=1 Tax=Streptomyces sp. SID6139 TaxID=2690320 RepID=UPI001371C9C0|nr:hypothetical protein [Streptomyces sp. SID6139]
MVDTITIRLEVKDRGFPDITYRNRRFVTPEVITFVCVPGNPGPGHGIYPVRAEVEGPCRGARPGMHGPRRTTERFYRGWPQDWTDWLIALASAQWP